MTLFVVTPVIRETLKKALNGPLPAEKKTELQSFTNQLEIPLETLKELSQLTNVYLHELLVGSKIALPIPPKSVIDPKREAHKEKLRKEAEDRAYFSMVKDITVENPLVAQKEKVEMRNALKDAAIPINMVLTAAGAFAFGYYFVNWVTHSFYKAVTAGTILATFVFFVEIALFIIRQQKEQNRYEGVDTKTTKILPFGIPGSHIPSKQKTE